MEVILSVAQLGGCAPLRDAATDVSVHLQRVVERRRQAGRVAGELSERRAKLPTVNVLRALGRGSGGLTLVGVVDGVVA